MDGGGSWAIIQLRALIDLYGYNATGYTVLQDFDLVAANSGGSITAAALAANWNLADALNLFLSERQRQQVFVALPWYDRISNSVLGLGPKYGNGDKFAGLCRIFGGFANVPLDQVPALVQAATNRRTDFIIPGFDYDRLREVLFRSQPWSARASFIRPPTPTMIAAVHASSSAPVNFFDQPARLPGLNSFRLWDGGVCGLNNPTQIGVLELLSNGETPASIEVLSIGTGTVRRPVMPGLAPAPSPLYTAPSTGGTVSDLKTLAGSVTDDPPDAATYEAYLTLGRRLPANVGEAPLKPDRFVRMSPLIQPISQGPDPVNLENSPVVVPPLADNALVPGATALENFKNLADLSMDAVATSDINLIQLLTNKWIDGAVYNQPVRSNYTFGCEIGHRYYPDAKADWLAVVGRTAPPPDPKASSGGVP